MTNQIKADLYDLRRLISKTGAEDYDDSIDRIEAYIVALETPEAAPDSERDLRRALPETPEAAPDSQTGLW